MNSLPNELLYIILSYCREYNVYLARVCKLWFSISKELVEKNNYTFLDLLERVCLEKKDSFYRYLSRPLFTQAIEKGKVNIISVYRSLATRNEKKRIRKKRGFISRAHLRTLQYYYPRLPLDKLELEMLRRDDPLFLQWLEKIMFLNLEFIFSRAFYQGKTNILTYLENKICWRNKLHHYLTIPPSQRPLSSCLWLLERDVFYWESSYILNFLVAAVKEGRRDLLELFDKETYSRAIPLLEEALSSNQLEIFSWLLKKTCFPLCSYHFQLAGTEEARNLLISLGCPWSSHCYLFFIMENEWRKIEWFYEKGFPITEDVVYYALCNNKRGTREWFLKLLEKREDLLSPFYTHLAIEREEVELFSRLLKLKCPLRQGSLNCAKSFPALASLLHKRSIVVI